MTMQKSFSRNGVGYEAVDPLAPLQLLPAGYKVYSYVLLIEERTCDNCGCVHSAPSQHMRVRLVNRRGDSRTIALHDLRKYYSILAKALKKNIAMPTLPQELYTVSVTTSFCQDCFIEVTPEQADMFTPDDQLLSREDIREQLLSSAHYHNLVAENPDLLDLYKASKPRAQAANSKKPSNGAKAKGSVTPLDLNDFL